MNGVPTMEGRPRCDAVGLNVAVGDPALAKTGRRACDLASPDLSRELLKSSLID